MTRAEMEKLGRELANLADLRGKLLECYRIGRHPSEKLLTALDKYQDSLDKARKAGWIKWAYMGSRY